MPLRFNDGAGWTYCPISNMLETYAAWRATSSFAAAALKDFLDFDFDVIANDTDVITGNPDGRRRTHDLTGSDVED